MHRRFRLLLPEGTRMWTVVNDDYEPHPIASQWLEALQAQRRSANTAAAYATQISAFLNWQEARGHTLEAAARNLHRYVANYASTPIPAKRTNAGQARSGRSVNQALAAVRNFYSWAIGQGHVDREVLSLLYVLSTDERIRVKAQHSVPVQRTVRPATVPWRNVIAVLAATTTARDRLMISIMVVCGLRLGQLLGLRREDLHLVPDAQALGLIDPASRLTRRPHVCPVPGPHLHVTKRLDNPNGHMSKSPMHYSVPVPPHLLPAFDDYYIERAQRCPAADDNDMFFVNYDGSRKGAAMTSRNVQSLLARRCKDAGVPPFWPHALRHTMATTARACGVQLEDIQDLLGQADERSVRIYAAASPSELATAVERVAANLRLSRAERHIDDASEDHQP